MNHKTTDQKLSEDIHALTQTLAASERRVQGMERLFKRLTLIVALLALVWLGSALDGLIHPARAANPVSREAALIEQDFVHLRSILVNLDGLLTKTNGMMSDPGFQQAMQDFAVLGVRLRQDSDLLRLGLVRSSMSPETFAALQKDNKKLQEAINNTSPTQALYGIQKGIQDEIHFLNGSIQTMVYSLDSTMGRVGRMMSPMPMPFGY
ncbi:MAG: hypothetical protein HQL95_05910 [Magnetococcales bacterium]|nr:hypothetical protein [Magnetococcales bacterium]